MTETKASPITTTRVLPSRDTRGRFVARSDAAPKSPRVASLLPRTARGRARSLPSRDARGRFVAFPTTSAPSWYVLTSTGVSAATSTGADAARRDRTLGAANKA